MLHRLLLIIIVSLSFVACQHDEPQSMPVPTRRTLLIYMAARNDLGRYGKDLDDIEEMRQTAIASDCRLLIFRATPYDTDNAPQLCELLPSGQLEVRHTFERGGSSIDPAMLTQALAQMRTLAPAAEYALLMWSHSTGWMSPPRKAPSRSFGLEAGAEMPMPALAQAIARANIPLEYIFFDSCYMGCVEVAYELRALARYMVASVCEVPYDGLPYHLALSGLLAADTPRGLRQAIDANHRHYAADKSNRCPFTLSLIDLAQLDTLAITTRALLLGGHNPAPDYIPQRFSRDSDFKNSFVDFRHDMAARTDSSAQLQALDEALAKTVIYERHSASIWGTIPIEHCCGLSINPSLFSPSKGYADFQWFNLITQPQ